MVPPPLEQHGRTLIELVIALAVALGLLVSLAALSVQTRQHYARTVQDARAQESARLAIARLRRELRLAGYLGCSSRQTTPYLSPLEIEHGPSDALTVRYAEPRDGGPMASGVIRLATSLPEVLEVGGVLTVEVDPTMCALPPCDLADVDPRWDRAEAVVVSTCEGAAIVPLSAVDERAGILVAGERVTLGHAYGAGARVRRLVERHLSIGVDDPVPGLRMREGSGASNEIVAGIDAVQLRLRDDGGAEPDRWRDALGVELALLVRSIHRPDATNPRGEHGTEVARDDGTHVLLDESIELDPLRVRRRVFATHVATRNRP